MHVVRKQNNHKLPFDMPVCVNIHGYPYYWPTIWSLYLLPSLAASTARKKLGDINHIYQYSAKVQDEGYLDRALSSGDFDGIAAVLEGYFIFVSNTPGRSTFHENRWKTITAFVNFVAHWNFKDKNKNQLSKTFGNMKALNARYKMLHVHQSRQPDKIRSIPNNILSQLDNIIDPESLSNPFFDAAMKWRAYCVYVLLLHQGLRRGELLSMAVDSIKSEFDENRNRMRFWMNVQLNGYEPHDKRYSTPSIKTANSIRQIPVSEFVANIVETYVINYRGRPEHSFLINSRLNSPLSTEALSLLFKTINSALPIESISNLFDKTGSNSLTPHNFRHSCAVIRLRQFLSSGDSMEVSLQKMRIFFGWSKSSLMPQKYARAVFDEELQDKWGDDFDARTEFIRASTRGA